MPQLFLEVPDFFLFTLQEGTPNFGNTTNCKIIQIARIPKVISQSQFFISIRASFIV
jgi:hypothetical protein